MRLVSLETVQLGLTNLKLHKLRSLLTSLGIIFGVAAVICMLSISEGASADEMRMLELLGTQNIIVNSVKPPQSGERSGGNSNLIEYGIKDEDVSRIRETIPYIDAIVPMKTVAYRARRSDRASNFQTVGTTAEFFEIVNVSIGHGRSIANEDLDRRARVCVIGDEVRKGLFPFHDPLGETILVERFPSSVPFTVAGVLKRVKTSGAPARGVEERNLNREILIPFSTAQTEFGETTRRMGAGTREFIKMQYSGLYVHVKDMDYVEDVSAMIKRVLEHGHSKSDYEVKVPLARLQLLQRKARNRKFTLGFIAGISLLVGGIGIMNIMLATVTERTKEIGIRRALGAKQRDIAVQFLVETIVLSTNGGVIGAVLGIASASMISSIAGWETIVSVWSVAISFGLSVLVGVFFGMYPAVSASRLDPIEALRRE